MKTLETQEHLAIYADTLFGLSRDAYRSGHQEAFRFIAERLTGIVPDAMVQAFHDSLKDDDGASKPVAPPAAPEAPALTSDALSELVKRTPEAHKPLAAAADAEYLRGKPPRPALQW